MSKKIIICLSAILVAYDPTFDLSNMICIKYSISSGFIFDVGSGPVLGSLRKSQFTAMLGAFFVHNNNFGKTMMF